MISHRCTAHKIVYTSKGPNTPKCVVIFRGLHSQLPWPAEKQGHAAKEDVNLWCMDAGGVLGETGGHLNNCGPVAALRRVETHEHSIPCNKFPTGEGADCEHSVRLFLHEPPISHWRAVSQNTSHLWDLIRIHGAIPATCDVSGHLGAFATRARNRPLDLVIDTQSYERLATFGRPLDLVLPLRHKLQHIHLALDWNEYQNSGLPVDNIFPVLTSIFIDIHHSLHSPQLLVRLVDSFGILPALRSLTLHAPNTSGEPLLLMVPSMVPWSQLTSLDLRVEMTVVAAQQILLQAQRLQTLVVVGILFYADVPTIFPIRILPEMRSANYYETTAEFFQPFSFPNLKSFNLEAFEQSQDILLDVHAHSGFRLEELELSNLELETDGLIPFLRLLPRLTLLSLNYCTCLDNNLFSSFTYNSFSATPPISLPLLQTLKLKKRSELLNGDVVVSMVESLSSPDEDRPAGHPFPRLTGIELRLGGPRFDSDVESRLATLSATGFLQDFYERYDPSESDDSDSSSDW
ncbi:hypothetical protein C8J57DRAFT_1518355 [Mycena rebaudengoi]|nr:hypothetical protein C8J57DRAFT_1518355 [Mycena rebaudengoi]